jgi:hypothetical protein
MVDRLDRKPGLFSRAMAASVLWLLDIWTDRKRAKSWRYWFRDELSAGCV